MPELSDGLVIGLDGAIDGADEEGAVLAPGLADSVEPQAARARGRTRAAAMAATLPVRVELITIYLSEYPRKRAIRANARLEFVASSVA
jgi:hypothetical protein